MPILLPFASHVGSLPLFPRIARWVVFRARTASAAIATERPPRLTDAQQQLPCGRTVERCDLRRHVPLRRVAEPELPRLPTAPRVHRARPARSAAQSAAVLLLRVRRAPCGAAEPRVRDGCGVYRAGLCDPSLVCAAVALNAAKNTVTATAATRGSRRVYIIGCDGCDALKPVDSLTGRLRRCGTPPARRRTQPAACNLQQTTGLCAAGSA